MVSEGRINWEGRSGKAYEYHIYPLNEKHDAVPANYLFARKTEKGTFTPIYAGETGDISERFDNHHKMPCIKREVATHLCTHKGSRDKSTRQQEESDIIDRWKPPCNDQ